jgi:diguanylate cyclase
VLRVLGCIANDHDPSLIALAVGICAVSCLSALTMLGRHRAGQAGRWRWLICSGVCLGGGAWATHFVAMLAYVTTVPITYDTAYTAATVVVAAVGATFGFALADRGVAGSVAGAVVMGAAIAAMHFLGMGGMRLSGSLLYDTQNVIGAIAVGVGLAVVALVTRRPNDGFVRRAQTAALLALSIMGLHFIAMSGTTIVPGPTNQPWGAPLDADLLAVAIASVIGLILTLGVFAAMLDERADLETERIRQLASATFEGILIQRGGIVIDANDVFCRMAGIGAHSAAGRRFLDFVAPEDIDLVRSHLVRPRSDHVEITLVSESGERCPAEILARPIQQPDGTATVVAIRDLTERRRAEEKVRQLAHHDTLTGLPNRALLGSRLSQALETAALGGSLVAVLCLDLDRFKAVNDLLGHQGGDLLLVQVARRLQGCVRAGTTVARLGGDEFAIIVPHLPTTDQGADLARRVVDTLSNPFDLEGVRASIGVSIGLAFYPMDGTSPDLLLRNADTALYCAKESGRGTFKFFDASMEQRIVTRRNLETDLRQALELDQLVLFYQPIVDCNEGAVLGYEALLRWNHPERGLIPPSEFIPLAEETKLIVEIGHWVLATACAEAASWPIPHRLAVNLSSGQFQEPDLVSRLVTILERTGLHASRLELEVTESVIIANAAIAAAAFDDIRALGVRIVLDDFGSGYSSLSCLRQFAFDKIKIDQTFVQGLGEDNGTQAVVDAMLVLARGLCLDVTAEGVETERQLEQLRRRQCHEVQGFLLGRPKPAAAFPGGSIGRATTGGNAPGASGAAGSRQAAANDLLASVPATARGQADSVPQLTA